MKSGRWRRRRCSSGRTSSIVTSLMSHFESTIERRAVRLARDVGRGEVALDDPLARVDQDERDVGALGRLERAQLGVVLDPLPLPALAAQAGGVDELERALAALDARCRSCRASCPAPPRRSCAPRRPARCRATTCRRSGGRGSRRGSPRRPGAVRVDSPGSRATISSSRSPVFGPCSAESGNGSPKPEAVELERERVLRRVVDLVREHEHRLVRDSRRICASSSSPGVTPARASTTNSTRSASRDRRARLLGDRAGDRARVGDVDAAGVDQQELLPVPLADELLAVARRALRLVDDRLRASR